MHFLARNNYFCEWNNYFESNTMSKFCDNLFLFTRRPACEVRIGKTVIGGNNPVAVQTMTNRDTNDTEACVEQIAAAAREGCRIVRLTTQGTREARNLAEIAARTHTEWPDVALVADVQIGRAHV